MVDLASVSNVGMTVLWIVIFLLMGLIAAGIIGGGVWLYLNSKRWKEYKVFIWERDGFGQLNQKEDSAGIFVDVKTKNKRFFLKKANVGLDPDDVPYLPSGNKKVVFLFQTGLKNFHFIKPNIDDTGITLEVGEEDVNWAINAYDRQKKLFDQSKLMQFLPYIALAFVSIIILVIFIYFFKEFGSLKDMAEALRDLSKNALQAKTGTVIIE
jgi:hypothetical protein|tara:strand:+ start:483 stop:1115 length:633 start_codon:yes stop_codon:yes gene_type:complete